MKASNDYIPRPVDTSAIDLPEELQQLVEQVAENVHEVWAHSRCPKVGFMVRSAMIPSRLILT